MWHDFKWLKLRAILPQFFPQSLGFSFRQFIEKCPETLSVIHLTSMRQFVQKYIVYQMFRQQNQIVRQVDCPPGADFADVELQAWLRKVIEEALRRNAKIILPPRLYMLSQKHNLPYQSVKINSSSGQIICISPNSERERKRSRCPLTRLNLKNSVSI